MNPTENVGSCYTRRGFVSATLSVAAGAVLLSDETAADSKQPQSELHTYNGSTDPYPLPWLDKFGDHHQPASPNLDPSDIFHFKGKIVRCADFAGMGTDNHGNRIAFGAPSTDFGIMQGEYFAARARQTGAFVHMWFTLFQGQVAPQNEVHDFHPPIAPSGLFWVAPIPEGALTFSPDGKTATLAMTNVAVFDEPKFPALDAMRTPATFSFRMVVQATAEKFASDDPQKQFRVEGYRATAQMEAQVNVPSIGFSWKSDPLSTSKANFAIIGDEVNGRYYNAK
jgi:hypothetical protein